MASCPGMDGDNERASAAAGGEAASDAELAQRVREGGPEADAAFARLHYRHYGAALRHARRVEPDADSAEDLVSDAFVEVLAQLRRGGGPRESFRAYLCTTIRNTQADRAKARKTVVLTADDELDALGGPAHQPADNLPDLMMVQQAFGTLPDRWQAVLWHTEVEGEKPRHIARLLGLTPNAVSQLAVRAREGLSEAFLKAHIGSLPEHCRTHGNRLGGYVRGTLRIRDRLALDNHLADCSRCMTLCAELVATNAHLRVLLPPALLGGSLGTAAAAEFLLGGAAGAGAAGGAVTGVTAVTGGTGAGAGTSTVGAGTVAGAGAGTGVGAGSGASAGAGSGASAGTGTAAVGNGGEAAGAAVKAGASAGRKVLFGGMAGAVAAGVALAVTLSGGSTPPPAPDQRANLIAEPAPPAGPAAAPTAPRSEAPPSASARPAPPSPQPATPPTTPSALPSSFPTTPRAPAAASTSPTAPARTPPLTTAPAIVPPPAEPPGTPPLTVDSAPPTNPPTSPPPTTQPPTSPPPRPVAGPTAVDDAATVRAGESVSLNLFANDNGERLYVLGLPTALGRYGWIACGKSTGDCTYRTWSRHAAGTDVFVYTVRDSRWRIGTATITITVLPAAG